MKRTIYNEEHEAFRDTIRTFIAKEIVPFYATGSGPTGSRASSSTSSANWASSASTSPRSTAAPGETSYKYQAIINEEVARAAVCFGHYPRQHRHRPALPAASLANEEQKRRWLPGVAVRRHHAVHRDDRARHRL